MAERDDEEYQFGDSETNLENEQAVTDEPETPASNNYLNSPNVKKRAIIALVIVVCAYILYALIASNLEKKPAKFQVPQIKTQTQATPPAQPTQPIKPVQVAPIITPQEIITQDTYKKDENELSGRVSTLETEKETISSQVDAVNNQIQGLATRIDEQNQKIITLNSMLTSINEKLDAQAEEIRMVTVRTTPKVKKVVRHVIHVPAVVYHIQAVIPGRAWLMSTQGRSVTVREGTTLPGYGVVQMIDAVQGRVMTSSGRMIRFSQDDS